MEKALFSIENLACGHSETALFRGLDAYLKSGETAQIKGDNGAGKTTLLRTIAGIHRPLAGKIHWRSPNAGREAGASTDSCFIAHENALNNALTPLENLDFLMCLAGQPSTKGELVEALKVFGLTQSIHKPCRSLSAGQKRRVSLARLWLTRAALWLLDEPAATLDSDSRAYLIKLMDRHVAAGGILIFTTHEDLALTGPLHSISLPPC
jgi:heme exporter protein A